jgi:hypothetical protein
MPTLIARLLAAAVSAASSKLLAFSALFAVHIAPRFPAVAVPAAVSTFINSPLAIHACRSSAFALGGSALVCTALPPHPAPVVEPTSLILEAEAAEETAVEKEGYREEEEEEEEEEASARRQLKMTVRGLPAHVSPHKLFDDFPQAVTVEALYHKTSGSRTSVVLTFDATHVPAVRLARSGASLTAIVHAPTPGAEYHIVAWTRPKVVVGTRVGAPPLPALAP